MLQVSHGGGAGGELGAGARPWDGGGVEGNGGDGCGGEGGGGGLGSGGEGAATVMVGDTGGAGAANGAGAGGGKPADTSTTRNCSHPHPGGSAPSLLIPLLSRRSVLGILMKRWCVGDQKPTWPPPPSTTLKRSHVHSTGSDPSGRCGLRSMKASSPACMLMKRWWTAEYSPTVPPPPSTAVNCSHVHTLGNEPSSTMGLLPSHRSLMEIKRR